MTIKTDRDHPGAEHSAEHGTGQRKNVPISGKHHTILKAISFATGKPMVDIVEEHIENDHRGDAVLANLNGAKPAAPASTETAKQTSGDDTDAATESGS